MTAFEQGITGNCYYDHNLPIRQLLCDMIHQALMNAQGIELSDGRYKRCRHEEKQSAIAYILSNDFEEDMDALDMPDAAITEARRKVTAQTHQIPLGNPTYKLQPEQREEIKARYAQGERKSHLAREYGLNPSSVGQLVGEYKVRATA